MRQPLLLPIRDVVFCFLGEEKTVFYRSMKRHGVFRSTPQRSGHKSFRPRVEFLEPRLAPANVDVLAWHNDSNLSGSNNQEEVLTPANVGSLKFGMLFNYAVDGNVYAQPLYKANLALPDGSSHNVVFVATEHDSLYAFDADSPSGSPNKDGVLWHRSFIDPANKITTVPSGEVGSGDIQPEIGITGTPVISAGTNTLYVIAKTKETRNNVVHYVQKLHAIDITTGQDVVSPFLIGDTTGLNTNTSVISVPGKGDGNVNGTVTFNALKENDRSSLLLSNDGSALYTVWASHGDQGPYHGWVIAFDAHTLQPLSWCNTTPNSGLGGIWQSGGGPALDPHTGNLFFATGNSKAANLPPGDLGESVVTLSANGQLALVDYFTPFNKVALDNVDADLGSGGTMILPDQPGPFPHLILETGKEGKIYVLNRDDLGKYKTGANGTDRVVQALPQGVTGVWGSPAFFLTDPTTNSGLVYYHGSGDVLKSFRLANGRLTAVTPAGTVRLNFPGAQPSVSSNGTQNGIVWELQTDAYNGGGPAILHAYDALTLSKELYRSDRETAGTQASAWLRDQMGPATKFTVPTITNGHVFAGTGKSVAVYGLFDAATDVPIAPSNLAALTVPPSGRKVTLSWTNNDPKATGVRIYRSTDGVNYTLLNTVGRFATTYTDPSTPANLAIATVYYYRVVATNQLGNGAASNVADVSTPGQPVLSLAKVCSTQVDLSWTRTGNDHYNVERSTDGTNFVVINPDPVPSKVTTYSDAGLVPGTYSYRVRSINVSPDQSDLSNVVSTTLETDLIDHSGGFAQTSDLTRNGSAVFADGFARLTVGAVNEAGTVFSNTPLSIANFSTTFTFRVHEGSDPRGEGFTFIIQANNPTQLGAAGGGLGYAGIGKSVAIKFDMFKPAGNHSSTGLYVNGDPPNNAPDIQASDVYVDLDGTGVDLNNQHTKQVGLSYNGTTLTETLTDTVTGDTFTTSYTVNIAALIGSNTAYIGFGGGTSDSAAGGGTTLQDIQTWTYGAPTTLPGAPTNLSATVSAPQVLLTWQCNSTNEDGYSIEQSTDGVAFAQIGMTARGVTTYTDTPAQPGTYYYRVRAFNVADASDFTNTVQVDVPPSPSPPPSAPGAGKPTVVIFASDLGINGRWLGSGSGMTKDASLGYNVPVFPSTMSMPGKLPPVTQVLVTGSTTSISTDVSRLQLDGGALRDGGDARYAGFPSHVSMNALDELFALDMLELS